MMDLGMSEPNLAKTPANKKTIVDAIVLAFAHSEVREVVGTDALRMVLDARYVEMVQKQGTLNLQPLWELLKTQPGFQPEQSLAPLCKIKLWEPRLGLPIELPRELGGLGVIERDKQAAKCKVPETELNRVLNPQASGPIAVPRQASGAVKGPAEAQPAQNRRRVMVAAGLMALAVAGVAGALLWTFAGGPQTLPVSEVSREIPLKEVKLMGDLVGGVLSDRTAWLGQPELERRRQLQSALEHAHAHGATRLVLMDDQGVVCAQASYEEDGTPAVTMQ
jgi:hypothetical protein